MRQLLNTLFVTSEDVYLSLDGRKRQWSTEAVNKLARYPLHTLQSILIFLLFRRIARFDGRVRRAGREPEPSARPAGRFLARGHGADTGKRAAAEKTVPRSGQSVAKVARLARMMIFGKVSTTARWSRGTHTAVIMRCASTRSSCAAVSAAAAGTTATSLRRPRL